MGLYSGGLIIGRMFASEILGLFGGGGGGGLNYYQNFTVYCVVSLEMKLYSILSLSTQVYKWLPVTSKQNQIVRSEPMID